MKSISEECLYFILKIENLLNRIGISIIYDSNEIKEGYIGKILYKKREIHVREQNPRMALMTIIHEVGHWFSYLFFFYRRTNHIQRESWAKSFGWLFLKGLKCPEKLVDYKLWCKFHEE